MAVRNTDGTGGIGSVAGDCVTQPSRPSDPSSMSGDRVSVAIALPNSAGMTVTRFDDRQTPDLIGHVGKSEQRSIHVEHRQTGHSIHPRRTGRSPFASIGSWGCDWREAAVQHHVARIGLVVSGLISQPGNAIGSELNRGHGRAGKLLSSLEIGIHPEGQVDSLLGRNMVTVPRCERPAPRPRARGANVLNAQSILPCWSLVASRNRIGQRTSRAYDSGSINGTPEFYLGVTVGQVACSELVGIGVPAHAVDRARRLDTVIHRHERPDDRTAHRDAKDS